MNRDEARTLLGNVLTHGDHAGYIANVKVYAGGKSALQDYWVVKATRLGHPTSHWTYFESQDHWNHHLDALKGEAPAPQARPDGKATPVAVAR